MNRVRHHLSDDAGFTLVELIIAIALLGIIIGPIMTSFLFGLLEADSTRDRVADSSSAQVTTAFLLSDVQSSLEVVTDAAVDTACLPADLEAAGTNEVPLQFKWIDPGTDVPSTVSYVTHEPAGELQPSLYRSTCAAGDSPTEIVQHLAVTDGFAVTCSDADDVEIPCNGTPRTVTVTIAAESIDPSSESSYNPLTFEIEATRRVS